MVGDFISWTLLVGLYHCKIQFGMEAAVQVYRLAQMDPPLCLYPGEMSQAADYQTKGGSADLLAELIQNDEIEAMLPFFPKLKDYENLAEIINLDKRN